MGEHPALKLLSMVLKDSQRWGILGGAFDPPHLGHLSLAESICEAAGLDGVLFLPTPTPPHKDKPMTAFADRHAMLKLAIAENKYFIVSRYEEELPAPHYTVNTLQGLTQSFPNVTFNLIVGADNLRILAKWYQIREVLQLAPALVGARPGQPNKIELDVELSDSVTFYEIPLLDISSTELRSRIAQGKSIRYLVPDSVIAYIQSHELYSNNHNK